MEVEKKNQKTPLGVNFYVKSISFPGENNDW